MNTNGFDTILVASNRGPVTFSQEEDGSISGARGSGGLVTALTSSLRDLGGTWVAAAMTDGDRALAGQRRKGRISAREAGTSFRLRYLTFPADVFDGYYNYVSNGILWFAYHYLWDAVHSPVWNTDTEIAWERYVAVNRAFAKALAEEASRSGGTPAFLIQDYHLSLVPRLLREIIPDAAIAHFSHTPFSGPTYTRIMPQYMRRELLRGLLGADVLGFHASGWAENFMVAARYLPGVRADLKRYRLQLDNREAMARVHPISVDAEDLRRIAADPETQRLRAELREWKGDAKLILRVDRMELTKNVWRGFLAYEMLLETYPEWRGKVKFLALLIPSRSEVQEYRDYAELCLHEAERINRDLGSGSWQPIEIRMRDDYVGAIAAYGLYDVLLVNPVYDGMNLVAMEGPVVNRRKGVLVLSRNAGAYSRLSRHAIGVNPFDIRETAAAMERGLTMPDEERARRARGLSRLVLSNPPSRWVGRQLEDLKKAQARRAWFDGR